MSSLKKEIMKVCKTGDFILTSGKKSDFYIDIKSLMFRPDTLHDMARYMYELIIGKWGTEIASVGGMELGSVPLSSAICQYSMTREHQLHHFVVRKEKRTHGTCSQIEGQEFMEDKSVVLIDDVLTTGGSLVKVRNIVSEIADVKGAIVAVNREDIDVSELDWCILALFSKHHLVKDLK